MFLTFPVTNLEACVVKINFIRVWLENSLHQPYSSDGENLWYCCPWCHRCFVVTICMVYGYKLRFCNVISNSSRCKWEIWCTDMCTLIYTRAVELADCGGWCWLPVEAERNDFWHAMLFYYNTMQIAVKLGLASTASMQCWHWGWHLNKIDVHWNSFERLTGSSELDGFHGQLTGLGHFILLN